MSQLSGKVQTVLGSIASEALGITMTHEHLLIDFADMFVYPEEASRIHLSRQPVSLENLWWVRYHWASNLDNMALTDEQTAIEEALRYKRAGGVSMVDATSVGIKRDPLGLVRISRATGLNVIMGCGYYVGPAHPPDMDGKSEDEIVEEIAKDLTEGVGDTGVKAGVIGEVGCSWPLTDNERKSLRASTRAQKHTGAPLLIHPGRNLAAPLEIMEIVREADGDPRRTIMSHVDRTIFDFETLTKLAETGCYIEYDLFGSESSYYPPAPIDMPNDGRRLDFVLYLRDQGRLDQVLMAQDICYKTRLTKYGGHGYSHILENVVPMMRRKGMTWEEIQRILVENPRRALTFA
ncbi:MAG: phosphotriesterase [Dehalococcoidia bacterium]